MIDTFCLETVSFNLKLYILYTNNVIAKMYIWCCRPYQSMEWGSDCITGASPAVSEEHWTHG